jgi:beta-lactamase class A
LAAACRSAETPLVERWRRIAAQTDGTVGAAVLHLTSGWSASLNGSQPFPLASVCKLPLAIHLLAMVDEKKLALDQPIEVPLYDVVPTVSQIAERWPNQHRFPLVEMIGLMIARSDNTAVQTLYRIGGGEAGITARFRQWGIDGMRLDRSERQCGLEAAGVRDIPPVESWTPDMAAKLTANVPPAGRLAAMRRFLADPRDTATPAASIQLLKKAFGGDLLSRDLTARLIAMMESTTTGSARLKGLLPPGTVVAHKTGTTATAVNLNGSTNDVGVIAGRIAIAVYVKGSTRSEAAREKVIAEIARETFAQLGSR